MVRIWSGLLIGICALLLGLMVLGGLGAYHVGSLATAPAHGSAGYRRRPICRSSL